MSTHDDDMAEPAEVFGRVTSLLRPSMPPLAGVDVTMLAVAAATDCAVVRALPRGTPFRMDRDATRACVAAAMADAFVGIVQAHSHAVGTDARAIAETYCGWDEGVFRPALLAWRHAYDPALAVPGVAPDLGAWRRSRRLAIVTARFHNLRGLVVERPAVRGAVRQGVRMALGDGASEARVREAVPDVFGEIAARLEAGEVAPLLFRDRDGRLRVDHFGVRDVAGQVCRADEQAGEDLPVGAAAPTDHPRDLREAVDAVRRLRAELRDPAHQAAMAHLLDGATRDAAAKRFGVSAKMVRTAEERLLTLIRATVGPLVREATDAA
jgi:hypothetical protein